MLEWILTVIFGAVLLFGPLIIQLIIYPIMRLCFKKSSPILIWWICFVVNNILLNLFLFYGDPDGLYIILGLILWVPWYIGVLIWGIVKTVKADAKASKKKSNDYITVDYDSSEIQ